MAGFLAYERIVARPNFPRWVLVPAAFAINISVGASYAFAVFNLPLTRVIGITSPAPDDWKLSTVGWIFTLTYVSFGIAAGLLGKWQDRVGPRVSGVVAALLWGSGFFVSALGVRTHSLILLYLGCGLLGGFGSGLGFTTPIAPLLKWFPDHRGLAMGFTVVGFGGGGIVAAPLAQRLMQTFSSPTSVGVAETYVTLGCIFLVAMLSGALTLRVPPTGWRPAGWHPDVQQTQAALRYVPVETAMKTPQFRLLWGIMLLNVTAGLGVAGQASAMVQEVFSGFSAAGAAFFVATLSFFNMGGRIVWAWASDKSSRRMTFAVFFLVGPLMYALVPAFARAGQFPLYVACFGTVMTFLGAGFALMPGYVADIFGTKHVGAINGRVLTALSVAGVVGPVVVNYVREYEIDLGIAPARAYDHTMYIMAVLLLIGFACNYAVGPVDARHFVEEKVEPPPVPSLLGCPDAQLGQAQLGVGK